jgi:hypothetical protein
MASPRPLPDDYTHDRYPLAGCVGLLVALVVSAGLWAAIVWVVWRLWP